MRTDQNLLPQYSESRRKLYRVLLLFIAGMGGLLYGADIGIIAAALLYVGKTVSLTLAQESIIVAAVLGGGMISSPFGGILADWFGRKKIMILSGVMFVVSVVLIVSAQSFVGLFLGRLLQGMSGGVVAVVVPLYLAETLSAKERGRGTAIFQFMLTFGIVIAALIGFYFTHEAQATIAAAGHNAKLILLADNHAWRGMFETVIYPGVVFFIGSFFLGESPRWLFRRGREQQALRELCRINRPEEAQRELEEMKLLASEAERKAGKRESGSLLKRKYIIPFVLACVILTLNQTTGINSVLSFLVVILKQAGLTPTLATQGDVIVKVLNCVTTLIGVALVDRKGRKFLLKFGTAGIVLTTLAIGAVFYSFESRAVNVKDHIVRAEQGNSIHLALNAQTLGVDLGKHTGSLRVLYNYGGGNRMATVLTNSSNPELVISPAGEAHPGKLQIVSAAYGAVPSTMVGWLVAALLAIFISCYAAGPGVVVWLTLSELMPTRIRSIGMGLALLFNQGGATLIAAMFLPMVGHYGYASMFIFWGLATVLYFLTATIFLPETKGKTLEEIEVYFEGSRNAQRAGL